MAIGLVVGWLLLAHLTRTRWVGVLGPLTVTFIFAASGGLSAPTLLAAPLLTWLAAQAPRASVVALLGGWWCTTPLQWMVEPPYPGARGGALLTLVLLVGIAAWVIRTAPATTATRSPGCRS
jgi:hypothetical protein